MADVHSAECETLYGSYKKEEDSSYPKVVVWAQIETGGPFVMYHDHTNCKFHFSLCNGCNTNDNYDIQIQSTELQHHQVFQPLHRNY
jgi:hypothetical protein